MVLVVRRKLEFQDGDSQQSLQAFCFIEIFVVFCVFRFGVLFWFCVFIFFVLNVLLSMIFGVYFYIYRESISLTPRLTKRYLKPRFKVPPLFLLKKTLLLHRRFHSRYAAKAKCVKLVTALSFNSSFTQLLSEFDFTCT